MGSKRKLSWRELQVVTIAGAVCVLVLFYLSMFRPLNASLAAVRREWDQKRRQLQRMEVTISSWEKARSEYQALSTLYVDLKGRLPRTEEIPLVMEQFHLAAQKQRLEVTLIAPGGAAYGERFAYLPISLDLTGDYEQVMEYLRQLQALPFPLDIQSLRLTPAVGVDEELPLSRLRVRIAVSVLLDVPEGGARVDRTR